MRVSMRKIRREMKVLRKFYKLQRVRRYGKPVVFTDAELFLLSRLSRRNLTKSQIKFIK